MSTSSIVITTLFIGGHYEVVETHINTQVHKYYYAGSQRIAMRKDGVLNFIIGDHLGSSSLSTDADGNELASMRYTAWGETRYATGSMNTDYQCTGQRTVAEIGLHFYNARWYDPYLNHFTQPDSIVPDPYNPQDWNRYSYVRYNPLKYTDPSGHRACTHREAATGDETCDQNSHKVDMWGAKTFPKITFSSNVKKDQEFTFYYALTLAWANNPDAYAVLDGNELVIGWNDASWEPESVTFGSCNYAPRCEINISNELKFLPGAEYAENVGQIAVEFAHEMVHASSPHRENSKIEEVKAFQQAESLRVELAKQGWKNLEKGLIFDALSNDINSQSMDTFLKTNGLWEDYGHLPYIPYR